MLLVLFVREHWWLFYNYDFSEDRATEIKDNKMARAHLATKTSQCKFNVNVKRNISGLDMKSRQVYNSWEISP